MIDLANPDFVDLDDKQFQKLAAYVLRNAALDHVLSRKTLAKKAYSAVSREISASKPVAGVGLTQKQLNLYRFIKSYIALHSIAPSYQQMLEYMGYASKSAIHRLVVDLEFRGYIKRDPMKARTITCLAGVSK